MLVRGASQRARPTAPTVLAREMHRSALRPPRSAIVRLRSGAVASRSGAFRIAAFRAGAGGRAVGPGARRFSARLHSATANPPSSARGNPSAATARLAWSRSLPAPIASVPAASCPSRRRIRSGPVAGTPRPLRAIGTCPFLRGAFRAPYSEQGESVARSCAENPHDIQILPLRQGECPEIRPRRRRRVGRGRRPSREAVARARGVRGG